MLGMVDIASQNADSGDYFWYKKEIIRIVNETKDKLKIICNSNEDQLYVDKLTFHFAHLQHWGDNYTPRRDCIDPTVVRHIKKRNGKNALRANNVLLDNKIVLVDMNVQRPTRERDNIHYDQESSRKLFLRMKRLFFRFSCVNRNCKANLQLVAETKPEILAKSLSLIYGPSCEGPLMEGPQEA